MQIYRMVPFSVRAHGSPVVTFSAWLPVVARTSRRIGLTRPEACWLAWPAQLRVSFRTLLVSAGPPTSPCHPPAHFTLALPRTPSKQSMMFLLFSNLPSFSRMLPEAAPHRQHLRKGATFLQLDQPSLRKLVFSEAANENGSTKEEHRDDNDSHGAHTAGTLQGDLILLDKVGQHS